MTVHLKNLIKAIIRSVVRMRLNWFPISLPQAERLANRIRAYPSIFAKLNYRRGVELPAGIQMEVGVVDVIERSLLVTGHWDILVEKTIQQLLKPGETFFDVGANIGYFSLMASRIVGDAGMVVSFEPSARALSRLTTHVCLNQCRNVMILSHALGEITSRTHLNWATDTNIGGSTIQRGVASQGMVESITVRRMDDVCSDLALQPNLIKMDIEGFELFALRGGMETLKVFRPKVICELTESFLQDHGQSSHKLIQYMHDLGYHSFLLSLSPLGKIEAEPLNPNNTPESQAEVLFSMSETPLPKSP